MKIWAYVILASLLIGAVTVYSKSRYNTGYTAAVAEQQISIIKDIENAVAEAEIKWEITRGEAETLIVIEERIVEKIKFVDREVPRVVETIKYECRDLGIDYLRVFNAAISANGSDEGGNAKTSTESDINL